MGKIGELTNFDLFRLKPSAAEITDVDKSFHGEMAYMAEEEGSKSGYKPEVAKSPSKEGSGKGGVMFKDATQEATTADKA